MRFDLEDQTREPYSFRAASGLGVDAGWLQWRDRRCSRDPETHGLDL